MHPPPERPTPSYDPPENRPRFGWRTNIWDWSTTNDYMTEVVAARVGFAAKGWDFAADQLDFYLATYPEGTRYTIRERDMGKILSTTDMQFRITGAMSNIKEQAKQAVSANSALYGVNMEITTDWGPAGPSDNEDVHNAVEHYWMAIGADVVVSGPSQAGSISAAITSKLYVCDFYYFHGTVQGAVGSELDRACVWLEEAGSARSYRVNGEASLGSKSETIS